MIGYIYKAYLSSDSSRFYIGSTTTTMKQRLRHHINASKIDSSRRNSKWNLYIRNNTNLLLLEFLVLVIFDDKKDLLWIEREYIELLKPEMNVLLPIVSEEEKIIRNKKIRTLYNDKNKDYISQRQKQYNKDHKDKIKEKKYKEVYYTKNKNIINEKRKNDKYTCECGITLRKDGKSKHNKICKG
jgi:hypothetical protein